MSFKNLYVLFLLVFAISAKAQIIFPNIDVQHYTYAITLNDMDNHIEGKATVSIKFLNDVSQFELNLTDKNESGKGMTISAVTENGKSLKFSQGTNEFIVEASAKKNSIRTYTISYSGIPADGLIISTNKFGHRTFFGDNWPNRAHNWIPCADYPSDKATLDFIITAPDHYQVVANGAKISETILPDHKKTTHWKESVPLATKVMVIGVAEFAITQSGTVNGVPVYTYVFPENKESGFKSYAYAPEIIKFYNGKIGPYPYEKLANVQSKTIFQGLENASAIFYFENSPGSKGMEALMAHEIAHQWFGDDVTEKTWDNLWLSEGFADYMTNCYLENKYGTEYLKTRLTADRNKVLNYEVQRVSAVVDTTIKSDYMKLLNPNSYEKGNWVLHMLRRKLGDTLFWKGISSYYAKNHGGNANTADLEQIFEQVSGQDLHQFFKEWLYNAGHPDLKMSWKYDSTQKKINITITQKQDNLFQFALEYMIDGKLYTADIGNQITTFSVSANNKPSTVVMDPNVNLLAGFEIVEE